MKDISIQEHLNFERDKLRKYYARNEHEEVVKPVEDRIKELDAMRSDERAFEVTVKEVYGIEQSFLSYSDKDYLKKFFINAVNSDRARGTSLTKALEEKLRESERVKMIFHADREKAEKTQALFADKLIIAIEALKKIGEEPLSHDQYLLPWEVRRTCKEALTKIKALKE